MLGKKEINDALKLYIWGLENSHQCSLAVSPMGQSGQLPQAMHWMPPPRLPDCCTVSCSPADPGVGLGQGAEELRGPAGAGWFSRQMPLLHNSNLLPGCISQTAKMKSLSCWALKYFGNAPSPSTFFSQATACSLSPWLGASPRWGTASTFLLNPPALSGELRGTSWPGPPLFSMIWKCLPRYLLPCNRNAHKGLCIFGVWKLKKTSAMLRNAKLSDLHKSWKLGKCA